MKNKLILASIGIVAVLIILVSFKSRFNEFIQIYNSSDYTIFSRREDYNSAWIKWVHATKKVKGKNGKLITTGGKVNLQLWNCDCEEKTYDIKHMITYDKNGKVLASSKIPIYDEPVIPETIGESIFTHICANNDYYYENSYYLDSISVDIDSTVSY